MEDYLDILVHLTAADDDYKDDLLYCPHFALAATGPFLLQFFISRITQNSSELSKHLKTTWICNFTIHIFKHN